MVASVPWSQLEEHGMMSWMNGIFCIDTARNVIIALAVMAIVYVASFVLLMDVSFTSYDDHGSYITRVGLSVAAVKVAIANQVVNVVRQAIPILTRLAAG